MTPVYAVFDDFLPTDLIDRQLAEAEFSPEFNPVDGLTYEGISILMRLELLQVIENKILAFLEADRCRINHMFLRLMTSKMPRSSIHADHVMGEFSMHVYLTRKALVSWGTQFWRHEEFGLRAPTTYPGTLESFVDRCQSPTVWTRTMNVEAKFNRALIHDASLWHSAVPADGFGTGKDDGRIVLTTFFSRSET